MKTLEQLKTERKKRQAEKSISENYVKNPALKIAERGVTRKSYESEQVQKWTKEFENKSYDEMKKISSAPLNPKNPKTEFIKNYTVLKGEQEEKKNLQSMDILSEGKRINTLKLNKPKALTIKKNVLDTKNRAYMNAINAGKSEAEAKTAANTVDITDYMNQLSALGYKTLDVENEFSTANKNLKKATMLQKVTKILQSADFAEKSKPTKSDDSVYNFINLSPEQKKQKIDRTPREDLALQMEDDEIKLYTYLYNKEGYGAAIEYFDYLEQELEFRQGNELYEAMKDTKVAKYGVALGSGVVNFTEGAIGFFDNERPITSTQYAASALREDLGKPGKAVFDVAQSIGNMVPSILLSTMTAGVGAAAGMSVAAAGTAGNIVGSASMGLSAAGNAYQTALREGRERSAARVYGSLVGIAEGSMQYAIGGISKLGGMSGKLAAKIEGINKAFVRASAKLGVSALSEGVEEGIQEAIDPIFKTMIFGDEYTPAKIEDITYAAVLGAVTGSIFEGGEIVTSEISRSKTEKAIYSMLSPETRNTLGALSDDTNAKKTVQKIVGYALQNEMLGGTTAKQKVYDNLLKEGITPSEAIEKTVSDKTKNSSLSESGLSKETLELVETLIEKLDTAFASAWYAKNGLTAAKTASDIYVNASAAADVISAAVLADEILNNDTLSETQKNKALKKANKLLPVTSRADVTTGTSTEKADRILQSATNYLSLISNNTADVSQNYQDTMIDVINETLKNTPGINQKSKSALVDLLLHGKVNENIKTVLSDPDVTELLSRVLGMDINENTNVRDIIKKSKAMLNVYKSGKGADYNSASKQKYARSQMVLNSLQSAGITNSAIINGFKNAIYNGNITEMQARAIAENETAFELYRKLTGGALDANSTLQDVIDAADLLAGFKLNGDIAEPTANDVKEIIESDTLVPDGKIGIYDSDTGRIILNSKATAEQKNAYILAHKMLTETEKTGTVITTNNNLDDYIINSQIIDLISNKDQKANVELSFLPKKCLTCIEDFFDFDLAGYRLLIEGKQMNHIQKRHGKNGVHDKTMANDEYLGKIEAITSSPDEISYFGTTDAYWEFQDNKNKKANTFLLEKCIGKKSYYVVIAIPKSKKKKAYVISAFIGPVGYKKEVSWPTNAKRPGVTSENETSYTSIYSIQKEEQNVKLNQSGNRGLSLLTERLQEYISRNENAEEIFGRSASKYGAYNREIQSRISSSILSPENLNNEITADFLAKLFNDKDLMNELARYDLELAVELAERVNEISESEQDKNFSEYAKNVYKDLFSVISSEDFSNELTVVLKERYEKGLSTIATDNSLSEGKINMDGVADRKFISKVQDWWHETKRGVVDSGEAIKRLSDKLGNETIYHLYNNSKQSKQAINIMLTKWQTDIEGNKIGESLKDIFLPIVKDQVKYKNFCLYMQYLNNSERTVNDKAIFPDVSREESLRRAESLARVNPEFKAWQDKVYKYIDGLMGWQLESGLLSQEQYDSLKASNKYYVPALMVRDMNTDKPFFYENVMISKGVSRAKGGVMETMPLLEALTLKTTQIVNEARMNKLALEMIETLKAKGLLTETIDGFEVSDAALQEFIYHVTATKKVTGFAPEQINGVYTTPAARKKLIHSISELFDFGEGSKKAAADIIRDYAQMVTLSETFDRSEAENVVNKLISLAIVPEATVDAPYYTQPELRRMLKDTKIYVSPEIVSEIPDYSAFSKAAFNKLKLTTKEEGGAVPVDSIYQELSLMHPDIFNPDITNPTEQLYAIHKAATETLKKPDNVSLLEYYKNDISDMKSKLINQISEAAQAAIKSAHAERIDISEKAGVETTEQYNPDSTDNFSFRGEQEGNRMAFYIDGVRHTADIGRGMFEGLKHIDYVPDAYKALIPIKVANSLFKKLVTSYNLFFSARNLVRDLQDAIMFSTDAPRLLLNLPKAYKEIASGGEMWQLYQSLGGVGSSYFDFKGEMDLASSVDIKSQTIKAGQKVVNLFEYINQAVEQAPRLAEFMTVLGKGDGSYASKMKALYAAADVTVNFGRSGIRTKFLNSTIVPFLNPGVQGASKFVRMFTERKGVKPWFFLSIKLLALGFSCGAINDLFNHDDEEYEQLSDYQKQSNILIKIGDGRFLKIPKGRSISVFGIASESIVDSIKGEDVNWFGVIKTATDQIAPNNPVTDNLLMPIVNAARNRTWYGGEIESAADENVKAAQRYDETTDYFSRWLGKVLNYSPKKINYILDSYSGVVGDYVLPVFTPQGSGDVVERTLLTAGSNFIVDSKASNRVSNDYYSLVDELTYEKNDVDNENNIGATISLRYLNSQTQTLYDFYDKMHRINSGELSPNEKAEKSRELKAVISGLMLNAMESQKLVYETAQNIESKYAYKKGDTYYDESGDEITYERYIDIITRETYRKVFGAEYALKTYNEGTYAKATEAVAMGATFDLYYDAYFDIKNIEGDFDFEKGTIQTGSARKNKWKHIDTMGASQSERAAVAKVLFDISEDKLEKATASGISMYEYIDFVCDTGTYKSDDTYSKKDKVLAYINKMQLSAKQKDTLYLLAGYSAKTIYNTPWH